MHIRPVTMVDVAPAQSIEATLDIISQILSVLSGIETLFFGGDIKDKLGTT